MKRIPFYIFKQQFLVVLLACFVLGGSAYGQGLQIPFERISVQEGLSQVTAYSVYEDKHGFIWMGTDDGLNRYDGYDFQIFRNAPLNNRSLSNNSVNSIQEDSEGNLWVGTDQGLNMLHAESKDFKVHRFDFHNERSLSSNTVWCMALDAQQDLWVGTANGLNRYQANDSSFTRYKQELNDKNSLSNNSINALYLSKSGVLWVGTNQGLNQWNPNNQNFNSYIIPGDESRYGQAVQCISENSEGDLLVGTNQGLFVFKDDQLKPTRYERIEHLKITALQLDRDGDLWVGTETGLYQYSGKKTRPIQHKHSDQISQSLSDNRITSIIEDSTGIIWIGTLSGGVNVYYREQQQIFHFNRTRLGRDVFPSDLVNCIEEISRGQFWLGTEAGIGVMKYGQYSPDMAVTVPTVVKGKSIQCIVKNRDNIAIGTDRDGVYLLNTNSSELLHLAQNAEGTGLTDDRISDLVFTDQDLWISTQGGGINKVDLSSLEISSIKYDPSNKQGLRDNRITTIVQQGEEAIWLGTSSAGVQRYDIASSKFFNYRVRQDSSRNLSNDKILSLLYDSAVIWVGTKGGGLNKIDLLTDQLTVYTTEDGLANNVVFDVLADGQGRVWMSTNKGISVLDIENENFTNYNDIDGLGNQSFLTGSGKTTSTGELLFGGLHGLDVIRYHDIELNSVLPIVYFTELEAFDENENQYDPKLSRTLVHKLESIELQPEISLVTLGFAALNYRKPEKNRYAYRLAGITDEWTYIEDRRYVTFSELAPGNYSLQIKAANNDGRWSEDATELKIKIVPSFYQRPIFKALAILAGILLVYFFYRFRVRRVTQRNKLLEERVKTRTKQIVKERDEKAILLQEIHHRVKNNLQIVNSLLRLQSHYVKDEEALWALDESQNRVMSMAMIHERMYKTENLANINIPDYIKDLCTDIISTYDLSNSVKLDIDIEVEKLNLDTLTPLGLIINEISSNAMKYAFPEDRTGTFKVHLKAVEVGRKFHLLIGDDGVGMPVDLTDVEQDSLGTTLMESLSEQLNGKLTRLESKGTMYEMYFEQLKDGVNGQ